jgi:hypothetical protein
MLPTHLRKYTAFYDKYGLGSVKNLWLFISILTLARTTNLNKLKDYVGGVLDNKETKPESHYKRLIRFFQDFSKIDSFQLDLQKCTLALMRKQGFNVLIMDGTSWSIGKIKIHYLVLSVLVGKVAVPVYWKLLGKLGASSQDERIDFFKAAAELFKLKGMTLLADREYIGKEWFKYLKDNGLRFVIRMKMGDYVEEVNTTQGKSYQRMLDHCQKKKKLFHKYIVINGCRFLFIVMPNPKASAEEKVILMLSNGHDAEKASKLYAKRWKIETMFKHLKTNGYNFEDMGALNEQKASLMMGLVALAYTLSIRVGLRGKIKTNKYQSGEEWPEVSVFREGIAVLTSFAFSLLQFVKYIHANLYPKKLVLSQNVQ